MRYTLGHFLLNVTCIRFVVRLQKNANNSLHYGLWEKYFVEIIERSYIF